MKKLTILHTIETGGPGGAETVLLNLSTKLDPERFRSIVVLCRDGWLRQRLLELGVPTHFVEWNAWYDLRLPRALMSLVKREKVDLIHSHLPDQNFYSCVAGRLSGTKTIVTYHGPVELANADHARDGFKLRVVRSTAACTTVVCDYVGKLLVEHGFPSSKIVRIYNGIPIERFNASLNGHFRGELGFTKSQPLIGMIANIRRPKGHEFFVRAARQVADRMPEARFVAVGDIDPTLGPPLMALVEELGLQDRFFFVGSRPDVPEVLSSLDLFVLSSLSEGLPLAVLEAMAAGKPVVVTNTGGTSEIVQDGDTGFLVPPGDANALAERMCQILESPTKANDMGLHARERIEREFTIPHMIQRYEQLYESILA